MIYKMMSQVNKLMVARSASDDESMVQHHRRPISHTNLARRMVHSVVAKEQNLASLSAHRTTPIIQFKTKTFQLLNINVDDPSSHVSCVRARWS